MIRILLMILLVAGAINAAQVLAVLEITPKADVENVSIDEMRHLTDELRKQAIMVLPQDTYSVLTRDNIIALIPPDEQEAECLAEGCAVDIGRAIGAEYVAQGFIGKFGKKLSISVELYETLSGKLLGSIVMESDDVEGLLTVIRQEAKSLFSKIIYKQLGTLSPEQIAMQNAIDNALKSSQSGHSGAAFLVGTALDVVGIGLITYGIVKNSEVKREQKKYNAYGKGKQAEIDAARKKMNDASGMRNVMYISGGVALGLGIGVHIWF